MRGRLSMRVGNQQAIWKVRKTQWTNSIGSIRTSLARWIWLDDRKGEAMHHANQNRYKHAQHSHRHNQHPKTLLLRKVWSEVRHISSQHLRLLLRLTKKVTASFALSRKVADEGDHLKEGVNGFVGRWGRERGRRMKPGVEGAAHRGTSKTLALLIGAPVASHLVPHTTITALFNKDCIFMEGLRLIRAVQREDSREYEWENVQRSSQGE